MSPPVEFIHQQCVIDVMNHMGYECNKEGVCFGIHKMLEQALFVGDLEIFYKRINTISELAEKGGTKEAFEIAFKGLPKAKQIEIQAFLDGVQLYMSP